MDPIFGPGRLSLGVQTDKSLDEYARIARRAEDLGFDGLSAFADLGYQPPLPALLAAAGATSRIRLGVACWSPTMLYPVEIAGQVAALDAASAGRAYLGLTRGAWLARIGLPPPGGVTRLEEAVAVIRALLSGDRSGVRGRHFSIEPGFSLNYRLPERPIPLLLGVWGPRGAALAARVADAVKIGGCANPAMVARMRSWLDAGCAAAGRPADAISIVAGAVTVVDPDREAARARARTEVAMYLDVVAALDRTVTLDPAMLRGISERVAAGDPAGAGALVTDEALDLFCLAGTPDEVAEHAAALVAAGASGVEFGTPHGLTARRGVEILGREVLPAVRRSLARSRPPRAAT